MTDKVTDGVNFSCAHLGPMSTWHNYRSDPPVTPVPARGKLFIKDLLGSTGLEMSINTLAPGRSMPFFHKHQNHDEVYFIIGGRGQFLIDGQCIDVSEGDAIRMTPAAVRAWRNHSDEPLHYLCIQYRADSVIQGGTSDGVHVDGKPIWPELANA